MADTAQQHAVASRLLPGRPFASLAEYEAAGGGRGLAAARRLDPDAVVARLREAGLRGRGGAGFATWRKWRSILDGGPGTRYVVVNAAEGEPGTFKDRELLRRNPYAVVEGLLIGALTTGASEAYVALKASSTAERDRIAGAIEEATAGAWCHGCAITLVAGPEEYLFGEEKALLEVIEGNEPLPRVLPPYLYGLFVGGPRLGWDAGADPVVVGATASGGAPANPTLVNNAETFAHVAWILANGADAFRAVGTAESAGTLLCTVVGDVVAPGVWEVPMGTPLSVAIDLAGGVADGRTVKAVFPGVATAPLRGSQVDVALSFEGFAAAGSGLGAGGMVVYDDSACMVEVAHVLSRFLAVESCGQCPPCKIGSGAITEALGRLREGTGTEADLDVIHEHLRTVTDGSRCALAGEEQALVSGILRAFPDDVASHLEGWCPSRRTAYPTPKLADLREGIATFDPAQDRKQPDWTYR